MINDPDLSQFDYSDIQDVLDTRRQNVRYALLEPRPTIMPGGTVKWLDYYAPMGYWEEDAVLYDRSFQPLTTTTADTLTGHWTFTANTAPAPAVYIIGKVYDVYGAAADLLERWVLVQSDSYFDTKEGDESQSGGQIIANKLRLVKQYRQQEWPVNAQMMREDVSNSPHSRLMPFNTLGMPR